MRARGNRPQTVLTRVQELEHFLRVVAPERDRAWLHRLLARLRAEPRDSSGKRARLQSAHALFTLGCRLMAEAEASAQRPWRQAVGYRDGLIIALLVARPLRLRNFAQLELGRHLLHGPDGWRLSIPAGETKTKRPLDLSFPTALVAALERYLAVHRPVLGSRRGRWYQPAGACLWLSADGSPLRPGALFFRVAGLTRAAFGRSVNPHLFRDAVATSIALEDPAQVRIAAQVLGHATFATTERHYNLARSQDAASAWHQILDGLRRTK
jgi:integrase/recombinase XerD